MLGRLAVCGRAWESGLQPSSWWERWPTPTQGAGRCWQVLEGAPQLPPFSQKAVCKEPCQQPRHQEAWEPQPWEEPAELAKDEAGWARLQEARMYRHPGLHCQGSCPSWPLPDPGEGRQELPGATASLEVRP